jgi:hypothetical protein
LRRKRRYPIKIRRKKVNTTYPLGNAHRSSSGRKWGKIVIYIFITIISVIVLKYIYDSQNIEINPFSEKSVDSSIIQSRELPVKQEKLADATPPFEKNIQIEILNACGISGIAKIFAEYLQQEGFDVVNTENYKEKGKTRWNLPKSKIIDQTRKAQYAEKIAETIGIPLNQIERKENPQAIYDISIVIGMDFRKLKGFQQFKK